MIGFAIGLCVRGRIEHRRSCRCFRCDRTAHSELRPPRLRYEVDIPPVSMYQAARDFETEAGSLTDRLGRDKRVENPLPNVRWNFGTVIHHTHHYKLHVTSGGDL